MRSATAQRRSLCRRNSAPKASVSPARCILNDTASAGPSAVRRRLWPDSNWPDPDVPVPPSRATAAAPGPPLAGRGGRGPAYHDVVDPALERALRVRVRWEGAGEPDEHVP